MSALEQIRKRPALVISILGLALLLFIFTGIDSLSSMFTSNRDTVAKVDGTKIKYQEWVARTQEVRQQKGNQSNVDNGVVEQEALASLVDEILRNNAIERLGITVTDKEMQNYLFGENALPTFVQLANQLGFETPEELYKAAYSKEPGAEQLRELWNEREDQLREQLVGMKYASQLGALTANKLDARAAYDDKAVSSTVTVIKKDFSGLNDDDFAVSDDEIRARYNENREKYAIDTEERLVDYILVRTQPSPEDYVAAQKEVEEVLADLKALEGVEAIASNYNFTSEEVSGDANSLRDYAVKNALESLRQDTVKVLSFSNNTYTIAKLIDSYNAADSVYVDVALINTAEVAGDSIVGMLNAGADIAALTDSALVLGARDNMPLPMVKSAFTAYRNQFANAPAGVYFLPEENENLTVNMGGDPSQNMALAVRVQKFSADKPIVEVAKITRKVEPSSQTLNQVQESLAEYLLANPTLEQFKANAGEKGYEVLTTIVDPSMLSLLDLPSSGKAARWAMDNKKGSVSDIMNDNDRTYYLVLGVEDIYNGGYMPMTNEQVYNEIATTLRNEKKAAKLVDEYKGKANDIEGYAQVMGEEAMTLQNVNFGQDYTVARVAYGDPALLANIAVANQGELVGPVATRNGAVVFVIDETNPMGREFDFDTDAATFNNEQVSRLSRQINNILRGNKKVKYSVQRFTSAD